MLLIWSQVKINGSLKIKKVKIKKRERKEKKSEGKFVKLQIHVQKKFCIYNNTNLEAFLFLFYGTQRKFLMGGALNFFFFFGGGVGGAARISELWGLRTDICLWKGGGACELKISNFGGLWTENLGENWGCRGWNFQSFSKGGLVNWLFCLKWDPCELQERREKGVFRTAHPHTPFLGQCPPGVIY